MSYAQPSTSLRDAAGCTWILPRPKKHATGMFFTPASQGPASSNPAAPPIEMPPEGGISIVFDEHYRCNLFFVFYYVHPSTFIRDAAGYTWLCQSGSAVGHCACEKSYFCGKQLFLRTLYGRRYSDHAVPGKAGPQCHQAFVRYCCTADSAFINVVYHP